MASPPAPVTFDPRMHRRDCAVRGGSPCDGAGCCRPAHPRSGMDRRRLVLGETADLAGETGQQVRSHGPAPRALRTARRNNRMNFYRRASVPARGQGKLRAPVRRWPGQGAAVRAAKDGESVSGKFTGTVQQRRQVAAWWKRATSSPFVPWRPFGCRSAARSRVSRAVRCRGSRGGSGLCSPTT